MCESDANLNWLLWLRGKAFLFGLRLWHFFSCWYRSTLCLFRLPPEFSLSSFCCWKGGGKGEGRATSNENLWWSVDPVSSETFQQEVINCSMCSEISLLVLNWGINMSPKIHHHYHNFTSQRQRTFNLMENSSLPDEWRRRLHCYRWDCAPIFIQICRIPFAVSKTVSAFFLAATHNLCKLCRILFSNKFCCQRITFGMTSD